MILICGFVRWHSATNVKADEILSKQNHDYISLAYWCSVNGAKKNGQKALAF